jgi:hypothetical protein
VRKQPHEMPDSLHRTGKVIMHCSHRVCEPWCRCMVVLRCFEEIEEGLSKDAEIWTGGFSVTT